MARIEIITIGDELVEGRLVDTNAGFLSRRLAGEGFEVQRHQSVGDCRIEIIAALREAARRSEVTVVSGGLGPTSDDLTAESVAEAFAMPLERRPEAMEHLLAFFASRGREMSPSNQKQAELPEGCEILANPIGTAVGFTVRTGACSLFFLPGVPRELAEIFDRSVMPDIRSRLPARRRTVAALKLFGLPESVVGELLEGLDEGLPDEVDLTVQFRASFPEIHVRLVLEGVEHEAARKLLEALTEEACGRLGRAVFAVGGSRLETGFAQAVVDLAREAGATIAVVDTATSGLLGQVMATTDGADEVFLGAVDGVGAARSLLGASLDNGVCTEVDATHLADVVKERLGASHGLAVIGAAPVEDEEGVLRVGVSGPAGATARSYEHAIDRQRWQVLAAYVTLGQLRRALGRPDRGARGSTAEPS